MPTMTRLRRCQVSADGGRAGSRPAWPMAVVRSPMERLMAIWKTEHDFQPLFTLHVPARALDLAALFAIGTAPVLLLLWAVPLPLVLPALSIASFILACAVALFAHCSGVDCTAPGMTAWDIVALFTLIWISAGMVGGSKQMVELFEQLATAP
jgi:hypothetical protein